MKIADIASSYDGEWGLMDDLVQDEGGQIVEAKVVAHSLDADELYGTAAKLRLTRTAIRCFQEMPDGVVFVL